MHTKYKYYTQNLNLTKLFKKPKENTAEVLQTAASKEGHDLVLCVSEEERLCRLRQVGRRDGQNT
jgi:hypothetical protein